VHWAESYKNGERLLRMNTLDNEAEESSRGVFLRVLLQTAVPDVLSQPVGHRQRLIKEAIRGGATVICPESQSRFLGNRTARRGFAEGFESL